MKVPLLDLKAQYAGLRDAVRPVMDAVCDDQYFILGPRVQAFEKRMAAYCGTAEAIGVSSGSDALLMGLMALGIGEGDAVLTSPFTFFATAGAIVRTGATPVFADIDPVTFNLSPAAAAQAVEEAAGRFPGKRLKAMIPVHLYGQCADMDPLLALAAEHGLAVIEDACQAIGAEYPGPDGPRRAGAMGTMGAFSFFPSKNLGGFGDGGLVTTADAGLAGRLRDFRNHGANPKYYHKYVGGNFRLDALQAVVLDVKLDHLEDWHAARRRNAAVYDAAFAGTPVQTPAAVYRDRGLTNPHIYNQYVVRVPNRDTVRDRLTAAGIGCEIYYPVPLHLQECFAPLGYRQGDFPLSEQAAAEVLALPIYPELTEEMLRAVVDAVLQAAG